MRDEATAGEIRTAQDMGATPIGASDLASTVHESLEAIASGTGYSFDVEFDRERVEAEVLRIAERDYGAAKAHDRSDVISDVADEVIALAAFDRETGARPRLAAFESTIEDLLAEAFAPKGGGGKSGPAPEFDDDTRVKEVEDKLRDARNHLANILKEIDAVGAELHEAHDQVMAIQEALATLQLEAEQVQGSGGDASGILAEIDSRTKTDLAAAEGALADLMRFHKEVYAKADLYALYIEKLELYLDYLTGGMSKSEFEKRAAELLKAEAALEGAKDAKGLKVFHQLASKKTPKKGGSKIEDVLLKAAEDSFAEYAWAMAMDFGITGIFGVVGTVGHDADPWLASAGPIGLHASGAGVAESPESDIDPWRLIRISNLLKDYIVNVRGESLSDYSTEWWLESVYLLYFLLADISLEGVSGYNFGGWQDVQDVILREYDWPAAFNELKDEDFEPDFTIRSKLVIDDDLMEPVVTAPPKKKPTKRAKRHSAGYIRKLVYDAYGEVLKLPGHGHMRDTLKRTPSDLVESKLDEIAQDVNGRYQAVDVPPQIDKDYKRELRDEVRVALVLWLNEIGMELPRKHTPDAASRGLAAGLHLINKVLGTQEAALEAGFAFASEGFHSFVQLAVDLKTLIQTLQRLQLGMTAYSKTEEALPGVTWSKIYGDLWKGDIASTIALYEHVYNLLAKIPGAIASSTKEDMRKLLKLATQKELNPAQRKEMMRLVWGLAHALADAAFAAKGVVTMTGRVTAKTGAALQKAGKRAARGSWPTKRKPGEAVLEGAGRAVPDKGLAAIKGTGTSTKVGTKITSKEATRLEAALGGIEVRLGAAPDGYKGGFGPLGEGTGKWAVHLEGSGIASAYEALHEISHALHYLRDSMYVSLQKIKKTGPGGTATLIRPEKYLESAQKLMGRKLANKTKGLTRRKQSAFADYLVSYLRERQVFYTLKKSGIIHKGDDMLNAYSHAETYLGEKLARVERAAKELGFTKVGTGGTLEKRVAELDKILSKKGVAHGADSADEMRELLKRYGGGGEDGVERALEELQAAYGD